MRAIFVVSGKGGVGKTKISRLIGELHRETDSDIILVDADASVGQLLKHLGTRDPDGKLIQPQPLDGVQAVDWHNDERGREQIAEVLEHGRSILVDLPGGSLSAFGKLDRESGYLGMLASTGFEVTFVSPISPWVETWMDASMVRALSPIADHLLVVNKDFGDEEDLADWHESKTRTDLLAAGSREIVLPSLPSGIAARIAKHRLTYHGARTSPHLRVIQRGRTSVWLELAVKALSVEGEAIGLPAHTSTNVTGTK